jgi:hypothetical protein
MSPRWVRWLSWLPWLCTAVLAVTGLYLLSVGAWDPSTTGLLDQIDASLYTVPPALLALVGAFVASRRPQNPIGWLISATGLAVTTDGFLTTYATYGLVTRPGSLPGAEIVLWCSTWFWPFKFSAIILILLLFPDGRLLSPRWRPLAWLAVIVPALFALMGSVYPGPWPGFDSYANPIGLTKGVGDLVRPVIESPIVHLVFPNVQIVVSVVAVVLRFWKARGYQRQQLKWFAYASVVVICVKAFAISFLDGAAADIVQTLTVEGLFLAVAIAVLRYRLYDIDLVINRTLVYSLLTAALAAIYFAGIVLLQQIFRILTGQGSDLAIVASTLAIAALFQPLRRRIQGFIDRRFYRRKYDAVQILEAFGTTVRDEVELSRLGDNLLQVVEEAMQPVGTSLWLRPHHHKSEPFTPVVKGTQ